MEGVSTVEDSQRKLAFWAAEVTYSHRATGPMLTAYTKTLRAERSAEEDNNSLAVQFLLHYHKSCLEVCVCLCVCLWEGRHISVWSLDCVRMSSLAKLGFASLCQICANECSLNSHVVCMCQYVGGTLRSGFSCVCIMCATILYVCRSLHVLAYVCMSDCV